MAVTHFMTAGMSNALEVSAENLVSDTQVCPEQTLKYNRQAQLDQTVSSCWEDERLMLKHAGSPSSGEFSERLGLLEVLLRSMERFLTNSTGTCPCMHSRKYRCCE